jgi:hypothetical protein
MKVILGRRSIKEDSCPMDMIGPWDGLGENMGFKENMRLWIRCVHGDA